MVYLNVCMQKNANRSISVTVNKTQVQVNQRPQHKTRNTESNQIQAVQRVRRKTETCVLSCGVVWSNIPTDLLHSLRGQQIHRALPTTMQPSEGGGRWTDLHATHRPSLNMYRLAIDTHLPPFLSPRGLSATLSVGATTMCRQRAEKEKWSSLYIVKRDVTGDRRMESRSLCVPALLPGVMMRCQTEVPVRAMSEPMAKQQQGLVLVSMSVAHITTSEHGDVPR